ncbi:MAG: hypothetical protein ABSF44_01590 [Candidatus Bathyarchaeia archaeon]|jgi:hypothetical protein
MDMPFSFWKNASPKRKRIYSIIFTLVLVIIATLLGTLVPLSAQEARQINDSVNQTVTVNKANGTLVPSIFLNNFGLCLAMFIPLVGAVFGLFVMFNTGVALGAELRVQSTSASTAAAASISATTAIIALVFFGLTFVLEFVSYSIGISESVWLFRRLTQRRWSELKNTGILIGVVGALLITGAIVETWVITTIG